MTITAATLIVTMATSMGGMWDEKSPQCEPFAEPPGKGETAILVWWHDGVGHQGLWMPESEAMRIANDLRRLKASQEEARLAVTRSAIPWWAWTAAGMAVGVAAGVATGYAAGRLIK